MGIEAILAKLNNERSIRAAYLLDGDFYKEVIAEESSVIESTMGMPLANRALDEVLKRDVSICIFCDAAFEVPTQHVMVLEDTDGNVVGHDVPECMMNDFNDNPDAYWLCDDFIMYPDRTSGDVVMVMLPQKVSIIGADDGVLDPILLYPATTTDILLKEHFKVSQDEAGLASAILSFNFIS